MNPSPRLKRPLKKSEKQIPRGLKPTRNDKNKVLVTEHLKVRPFKTRSNRLFQQPMKPCPDTKGFIDGYMSSSFPFPYRCLNLSRSANTNSPITALARAEMATWLQLHTCVWRNRPWATP